MAQQAKLRKQAQRLKGQPVCITLHNGRSYVGWITDLNQEAVILSRPSTRPGPKSKGRRPSKAAHKANVSSFMPLLGSLMGGAGGAGGLGRLMGMFGMVQKAMPVMKMGYNMIKSIRPFLGGLKGLMG
ncbi:hypothetical protein [Paenibacillus piscarius]|uniref:hypothetical protein n=1 Tax=Paenibacillus piscarius TaxID=1089681 RepID=UPI001EE7BDEE|nr:hypothetical protein [Paenibacillus piscarius]